MKVLRLFPLVLLPVLTLALGWHMGSLAESKVLQDVQRDIDLLSQGGVGSGVVLEHPEREVDLTLLWGVWRLLLKHYSAPELLDAREMFFGAIQGLVSAVGDPYTMFMSPEDSQDFYQSLQGELQGIGAELTLREGKIVVVSPLRGSPAEKAGLMAGDTIAAVDGEEVEAWSLSDVVHRIRGIPGTSVTLTITREGKEAPLSFHIVRADIKVPSVEYEVMETGTGSIGYVKMNQFGQETIQDVTQALRSLDKKNVAGFVIDLRFNGGGYLEGAVDLVSLFLQSGEVVSVKRREGEPQRHYVSGRPLLPGIPLVVMINEGSASASEIVAGALQDHVRATIVGVRSFGKGTVQEVFDLPGGSSVRITTAHWFTPKGRDLGKEGVEPDITVTMTEEDRKVAWDPQLQVALEWLLEGEGESKEMN